MKDKKQHTSDGSKGKFRLSLRMVIITAFLIGLVIGVFLIRSMYQVRGQYAVVEQATLDYVDTQANATLMQESIRDLDEFASNFVINGNEEEVIKYFNELQVKRTRDTSMEAIIEVSTDDSILKHLNTAISLSDQMIEKQLYAMRLAISGFEFSLAKFPQDLRDTELSEEDEALPSEEKLARAREMLFDKEYSLINGQVDIRLNLCKEELLASMKSQHEGSSEELQKLLDQQRLLILIVVVIMLLVLIFVLALVVNPIMRLIANIQQEEHALPRGSAEIRFLADTYNRIYDKMEDSNSRLSYEASHDALTGLFNRAYYEELREENRRNVALLIVDIDYFKSINDTWGHEIGDKVLIRVANVLVDSFRDADRVCRIGGDEFAVVMMDVNASVKDLIRRKFKSISEIINQPQDDIPPVTISIGGAFSEEVEIGETLFRNADRALYKVKQDGRNGCAFYSDISDETRKGEE